MEINLTKKQEDVIKKITKKDADIVVNQVISHWFDNLINTSYDKAKTVSDKVDELNTKLK